MIMREGQINRPSPFNVWQRNPVVGF